MRSGRREGSVRPDGLVLVGQCAILLRDSSNAGRASTLVFMSLLSSTSADTSGKKISPGGLIDDSSGMALRTMPQQRFVGRPATGWNRLGTHYLSPSCLALQRDTVTRKAPRCQYLFDK